MTLLANMYLSRSIREVLVLVNQFYILPRYVHSNNIMGAFVPNTFWGARAISQILHMQR